MPRAVVHTPSGSIEGKEHGHGLVFRGIPFAAPPIGPGRFRAPEKLRPWQGVCQAGHFGPAAPQVPATILAIRRFLGTYDDNNEDCLYLNVWTPAADTKRRPVMVWIHGGAFLLGSGAAGLYSGSRLASRGDVVVVTINYRLGVLGSLDMLGLRERGEGVVPNLAIRDQIAALEWVRDHIEAFGGDPTNVTVFGESAGAMSVGTLLGTAAAGSLFHRAILQSGAASNVSSRPIAERVGRAFLRYLGLPRANPAQLRRVPIGRILAAQTATLRELANGVATLPWQPTLDGDLLPEQPLDTIRNAATAPVPVLIGSNRNEWALFMAADSSARQLDEPALRRRFRRVLGLHGIDETMLDRATSIYDQMHGKPPARWSAFMADLVFHAPAVLLADTLSRAGGPVYFYRFDGTPPLVGGYTGSFHGLEIPFVFGTVGRGALAWTMGSSPAVRTLSRNIQQAWVRFAHSSTPGHEGLPAWPRWTDDRRDAMLLGPESRIAQDPHEGAREFWTPLLDTPRQSLPETKPRLRTVQAAQLRDDQPPRVARE